MRGGDGVKCLVCEKFYHFNDNWYGWWGENQVIRNDEGVFVKRGIYCKRHAPDWVRKKMEE
jgi:hypothetical protein|tara:strand:- start:1012 stop:1194 length:183 start_codon:yes stop_codon:yes gene_type:complete